ncbi:8-oxoguanine deaminase [Amycolatopsis rubida]|uniref:8-oxoguanine deaminase n=1 Tax=Amycolatopsis rubida TaxID=112413 RepID=A0ABX0C6P8_9PSEU|nr:MULTISPECIES: 8-oxoguanine deaminase [Amycolatopsis]MYW95697.1 8-oxoguanine deaminase [Amycolatopsis rubida]NEC60686.1 8-oxoguanine deaminase [Amycolatopsis rubida]OAP22366.1 8-oxoguanine deaminase [Amycolatopsis sp. M39]
MRTVVEHAAIATVSGPEHRSGHVVLEDDRIAAVGDGTYPGTADERVDATGCLVTPGLVNTHHHLYQWATRGLAADHTLFEWLVALYPVWAKLDAEITHAAGTAGMARLALSGCTTVADHHYVFPSGGGDQVAALVAARERIGLRLHLVRGSMDRGESDGGLPPDSLVETAEEALLGTEAAIDRYHDASPGAHLQIAAGPCSPFTVTERLMADSAELARRKGIRLHTHLAETQDEEKQCLAETGLTPAEYADKLGWLASDVWLAHTVHLAPDAIRRFGATATGSAHCPTSNGRLGSGIAPVRDLLDAGAPVGLGVDGAASSESGGLADELHQALLQARQRGGPTGLTTREALWLGTMGGARCLGRERETGSVEVGKLADLAVWDLNGLNYAGIEDPVAALVLAAPPPLRRLFVGGKTVVDGGRLKSADETVIAGELAKASARLRED